MYCWCRQYNQSLNLAFRGQVQLGVEGRDRAFGRRARPSGRPAHFAGVSQCRWRVSAPAGRSSFDPAGGAVAPGAEAGLRTHRRRTSAATARREHAPLRRALPLAELRELGYTYVQSLVPLTPGRACSKPIFYSNLSLIFVYGLLKHSQQHTKLDRATVLRRIPRSRFAAKSDNLA